MKEMLSYCGWLTMGAVAILMRDQGVAILVNKSFGPKVNAAMAIGNTLSSKCTQLSGSLEGAFWPAIISAYGKGDIPLFQTLACRVSKFSTCLILLFAVPLALEVDEVLILWLKNPPSYTSELCVCFLVILVIDKLTTGHCTAINAVGKVAVYQAVISAVLLLTVPVAWVLFACGCNVYAVSYTVIGTTVGATITRVVFARRIVGLSISLWVMRTVLPMFVAVCVSGLFACVPRIFMKPSFLRIVFTSITFLISYLGFVYYIVMNSVERLFITEHVKERFHLKG